MNTLNTLTRVAVGLSLMTPLLAAHTHPGLLPGAFEWHGGTYRGPGDTVPPAGGGLPSPATPTAPTSPAGPTGPSNPTTPTGPNKPGTPGIPAIPTVTTRQPAVTPGAPELVDLTTWDYWWEFNKEPYLDLKAKIHSSGQETGEGDILTGISAGGNRKFAFKPTPKQIRDQVVPALLDALQRDAKNVDLMSSALIALGKIDFDTRVPEALASHLSRNRHQEIVESAALSLGIVPAAEHMQVLLDLAFDAQAARQLLDETDGVPMRTRVFATYALSLLGRDAPEEAIRQNLSDRLWDLLQADQSAWKDLRVAAVIGLGLIPLQRPQSVVQRLTEVLADENRSELLRAHVPNAIAKLLRESPIEDELRLRATADFRQRLANRKTPRLVRQSCVQALGILAAADAPDAERILASLAASLADGRSIQEKHYATISLAYLGAEPKTQNPLRGRVTELLLRKMDGGQTGIQPWCAMAIGVMAHRIAKDGQALSSIVHARMHQGFLEEKVPMRKAGFAVALGLAKAESAKQDLFESIQASAHGGYRGYAALGLGLMDAREYRDDLRELMLASRRDAELLRQVSIGLGLLGDRRTTEDLLSLLHSDEGGRIRLSALSAVAKALGFIGDRNAIRPLIALVENPELTPLGRAFAAAALGTVSDKQSLPWNAPISGDLNYRAAVTSLVDTAMGSGILDLL